MESLIKELGLQFRNITQHSDGRFSCKLMHKFGGTDEFWGETPAEALNLAVKHLSKYEE